MRPFALLIAGCCAVLALSLSPGRSEACSFLSPTPHEVDPALRATDQTPPTSPGIGAVTIKRGRAGAGGCGGATTTCDDIGTLFVQVSASDDQTSPQELGYRLVARGAPDTFHIPTEPIRALSEGILITWLDGATDDQEALGFVLEVTAIDRAGNESTATTVEIRDEESSGCTAAGGDALSGLAPLALAGLALQHLRRRTSQPAR